MAVDRDPLAWKPDNLAQPNYAFYYGTVNDVGWSDPGLHKYLEETGDRHTAISPRRNTRSTTVWGTMGWSDPVFQFQKYLEEKRIDKEEDHQTADRSWINIVWHRKAHL